MVKLALPFFAITLFVSAFLLFLVQPLIGKIILPILGGTPQVWNTCMVFFQAALLLGYGYTHMVSTRLKLKMQLLVHSLVLLLPIAFLIAGSFYVKIRFGWVPPPGSNPIWSTLWTLATVVGIPFLVVATSAPLLQRWFAYTGHPAAQDPYFLYGASNLGSFGSLLAYPFLIEPFFYLDTQSWGWTWGYIALVVLVFGCVGMVLMGTGTIAPAKSGKKESPPPEEKKEEKEEKKEETAVKAGPPPASKKTSFKKGKKGKKSLKGASKGTLKKDREKEAITKAPSVALPSRSRLDEITPMRRLRWVALAAVPSSLMLGVTTYITTDLSPIPLLWIIPLMLYLITFVFVFARWPVVWVETPHKIAVIIQPFALALLILFMVGNFHSMRLEIIVHVFAFFITTLVCHGELAKDRPSSEHLTEFYLLMSVGGVLGGMFNALLIPLISRYVIEYGLAIFLAGMLRPTMSEGGVFDEWLSDLFGKSDPLSSRVQKSGAVPANFLLFLDIAIPVCLFLLVAIFVFGAQNALVNFLGSMFGGGARTLYTAFVFGIPMILSLFLMFRPIRYGLTIGGILLVYGLYQLNADPAIFADRSYFGVLRVREGAGEQGTATAGLKYTTLIHGRINHGMNYNPPANAEDRGNWKVDFSRLATTYYHRRGPAGVVMEQFNWWGYRFGDTFESDLGAGFPDDNNTFYADARMPVSLIGQSVGGLSSGTGLPTDLLVDLWSEPPYATIGLGTGTMASYARPFQHMHYYEIDNHVLKLSVPPPGRDPFFTYLRDAKKRGAEVWVLMGDARQRMKLPYPTKWDPEVVKKYYDHSYGIFVVDGLQGGGPDNFYHMMVVDAFSSDAIPVHLITKEALRLYFRKLSPEGILCVHTSNRYVDLVPVVADVANAINNIDIKSIEPTGNGKRTLIRSRKDHCLRVYHERQNPFDPTEKISEGDTITFKGVNESLYPGLNDKSFKVLATPLNDEGRYNGIVIDYQLEGGPKFDGKGMAKGRPFASKRGHDVAPKRNGKKEPGHFTSEWVMVARSQKILDKALEEPTGYLSLVEADYLEKNYNLNQIEPYWTITAPTGMHVWTDDYSNLMAVFKGS